MTSLTATRGPVRAEDHVGVARSGPRSMRLTARGRLLLVVAVVVLVLGAFAIGRSASSQAASEAPAVQAPLAATTVQPGDTLWSVARRVAPKRDARDVVAQLRALNHLEGAALQVGQQLLLPTVV